MRRREDPLHLRFLTFSTYRWLPLFRNAGIRDRFAEGLAAARAEFQFRLVAWVVMPEHVHLLLQPKPETLVPALASLKAEFAREVLGRWRLLEAPVLNRLVCSGGKTRFWQPGGGYDRNVFSREEIEEKILYVHHNPVKRGLVNQPEDWHWSSARWYAGLRDSPVSVDGMTP